MRTVYCYTDGSCLFNNHSDVTKRRGGVGVVFMTVQQPELETMPWAAPKDPRNRSKGFVDGMLQTPISNQTMELYAIYEALLVLFKTEELDTTAFHLFTDSKYCYSILTNWGHAWKSNDWKKKDNSEIKNLWLIKKVYTMYHNLKSTTFIAIHHIRAHKKAPQTESSEYQDWYGNDQADRMAQLAAKNVSGNGKSL